MGAFIAQQPNGLYCRFSTVVDTVTHYNMTREDYLNNVTGTTKNYADALDTLENYLYPFNEVLERFEPRNMSKKEFDELVKIMSKRNEVVMTYEEKYKHLSDHINKLYEVCKGVEGGNSTDLDGENYGRLQVLHSVMDKMLKLQLGKNNDEFDFSNHK